MGSKLVPPQQARGAAGMVNDIFQQFDVVETSYHFYGARIDLHICDEPSDEPGKLLLFLSLFQLVSSSLSAPTKNTSANDGALQLTLQKLSFDFYPYHLAGESYIVKTLGSSM